MGFRCACSFLRGRPRCVEPPLHATAATAAGAAAAAAAAAAVAAADGGAAPTLIPTPAETVAAGKQLASAAHALLHAAAASASSSSASIASAEAAIAAASGGGGVGAPSVEPPRDPSPGSGAAAAAAEAATAEAYAEVDRARLDHRPARSGKERASSSSSKGDGSGGGGGGSGGASASGGSQREGRDVRVPPFLTKLYTIVDDEQGAAAGTVGWTANGTALRIADPARFADECLPRYFKHNKLGSFQQQLLTYGFTRLPNESCLDVAAVWQHAQFQRGRPELLEKIHRAASKHAKRSSSSRRRRRRRDLLRHGDSRQGRLLRERGGAGGRAAAHPRAVRLRRGAPRPASRRPTSPRGT